MARFLVALLATTLVAVQAGGQLGHAAPATAEVFWRAVLPHSPLPDAVLRLLKQPAAGVELLTEATSFVRDAEDRPPFDYRDYSRSPPDDEPSKSTGAASGARDFDYDDYSGADKLRGATDEYKAPSSSLAGNGASMARGGKAETTTVFFHEEAVRVGKRLPFRFPPATPAALGFLPRQVADSVPFTTAALPGVLATFGVASDSATVASMEATLRACESPTIAGESKFCATSLEALVERAMEVLGTRDIRPVTSTLPRAGAPLQTYTVRSVRPVEGGPVFVACHDEAYPYTVYRCHTTGPSRAYMVDMEGARGGDAVTIATVCHTDTSLWNPEHVSFKLLGTKPGGTPVCHLMPYGHIIWAKNVNRSPA
ncbi:unnamed protein product [Triticum turgidum subsp. durum]|uniref:BURP domain-containing protein n=1 Tax=Triticum turgidum subsp. durum TaxID=4567 RepID=A0A9R1BM61_TRITD|nr:unnamed protein product [Triticum turgidum subsp. durum]